MLLLLASVRLLVPLLAHDNYGFAPDELYYLASGLRLDWGYVDVPIVTPFLAWVSFQMFGGSLVGLRLFAALASAGTVILTGLSTREMGGGRFAQVFAALLVLVAPVFLATGWEFTKAVFDQLVWVAASYLLLRRIGTDNPKLWLPLGMLLGVGLLTKYTIVLYGIGLIVGMLATSLRADLRTRWPWLAAGIALAVVVPSLLWQVTHGFPTFEFARSKLAQSTNTPLSFLWQQAKYMGPVSLGVALAGLAFLFSPSGQRYRVFGWIFVGALLVFLVLQGENADNPTPVYAPLLAAGAVAIEMWIKGRDQVKRGLVVVAVLSGIVAAPLALPLLPRELMVSTRLYAVNPGLAWMLGWEELVSTVAGAAAQLPPTDRANLTIVTSNYSEAAAIERFGGGYGLPRPISGHMTYYLWGPGAASGEVILAVGFQEAGFWERFYGRVEPVATITNSLKEPNREFGRWIFLCREPKLPFPEVWPQLKHFEPDR